LSSAPEATTAAGRGSRRDLLRLGAQKRLKRRIVVVGFIFLVLSGLLGWRLVELQIMEPDRYLERGLAQRIRTVTLPAARGAIVDRNGVDLALSVPRLSVVANPGMVDDPAGAAIALAGVLGTDIGVLEERLSRQRSFVYLDRQVDSEVADNAMALDLSGVYTRPENARLRPGDGSGLALLGRTDIDSNGISGLELVYDNLLSGTNGEMIVEAGLGGSTIPGGEYRVEPAEQGLSLVLTIDRALQFEAERLLADGVEAAGGKGGVLVAMSPTTGEVLASATVERGDDGVVRPSTEHKVATWTFEPGSIMKPLTMSAVLETGTAAPDTVREVPGNVFVHDADFKDSFPHGTEEWSVADILRQSSNVGTILWAQDLGEEALYRQLLDYGLGAVTDLRFPGEARGILTPVGRWSGTSLPTIAIGQGVSATPIQMLTAFATLANDGRRPAPTLVRGSLDDGGVFTPIQAAEQIEVVPPGIARSVVSMMEAVVSDGTGKRGQVPGYRVAGKTGTAWKPLAEGGYGEDKGEIRYVASFAGFLPAEAPELVILVVVDEPARRAYSGGRAAAPIFSDYAQFAVRQLRMPSEFERTGLDQFGRVMATTPARASELQAAEEAALSGTG
tara:strand:+ start:774 stop:2627 length:1854 start_codon:yes stop_codon:yes gene_type:complete